MSARAAIAALAALHLSACATVVQGKSDTVKLSSTPGGADVVFEDAADARQPVTCTTPCEAKLRRTATWNATVSLPGHTPYRYRLSPGVGGSGPAAMAGNLIAGGVVGAVVDSRTGALRDLSPNPIHVTLAPVGEESFANPRGNRRTRHIILQSLDAFPAPEDEG